ncbi:MAG: 50S ribosomal protein L28 [Clostridiales bacterium]|jgi:large subunit ribosomal protein L28|nr:50S ribosomal protein L28 [Clostridiales bacterium]
MARCEICNKSNLKGHKISITRSQVSRRAKKVFKSNIKKIRVVINGTAKKISVCTSCMRTNKIKRAV